LNWATLARMDENLGHRFLASPKRGGAVATALTAAPPALSVVHLQILRREWMPLAASGGYLAACPERVSEQPAGVAEAHDTY
jgi:hypothetical protein